MKTAKGPRPWSINAFCAVNLLSGLFELARGIVEYEDWIEILEETMPGRGWTYDDVIVSHSALFTIVLIPLVAIWFFASKTARALVTVFSGLLLASLIAGIYVQPINSTEDTLETVYGLLMLGSIALLFTPSANRWFNKDTQIDPATFD